MYDKQPFACMFFISENTKIVDIMDGFVNVKEQNVMKAMIELFYGQLCEIKPSDFLPSLFAAEVLR